MKSGPLDQTRFKSGHQISQTSRLKRRLDLDRRIFCTNDLHHKISRRYIDRYIENIADISPIFSIYRRYISKKKLKIFPRARFPHVSIFRPICRSATDISPKYRRYLPIFHDFSCKRLSSAKIASFPPDIRYIAEISADIFDISVLACNHILSSHSSVMLLISCHISYTSHLRILVLCFYVSCLHKP